MCDVSEDTVKTTISSTSNQPPYDPAYHTWSLLFRTFLNISTYEDQKRYLHNQSLANEERDCRRCEDWRDWLFQWSPTVRFLQDHVRKLGGELDESNVLCRRCNVFSETGMKQGAFSERNGILLCANFLNSKRKLEDTLAHEMVHAYDHMRFKFDKMNLKHVACSEVRVSLHLIGI